MKKISFSAIVRHLFTAWLLSVLLEFLLLPSSLRDLSSLDALAQMQFARVLIITAVLTAGLTIASRFCNFVKAERWCMAAVYLVLMIVTLSSNFSWALCIAQLLVLAVFVVYAITGHDDRCDQPVAVKAHWSFAACIGLLTAGFCILIGSWSVYRYLTFSTPNFDFGLFAQMFHNMRTTGLPLTTLERDKLLSHFAVHVSPIYYLMLPLYCLFPDPATLQIQQVLVIASAVIPLWLICKHHGLSGVMRLLLCSLLLLIPVTAGGVYYDLHENCFLLPLILWLMYGLDRKSIPLTVLFAVLTLCVKEDAAVYVAVAGLYGIVNGAVKGNSRKEILLSAGVLTGAIVWFLAVTGYLEKFGDGVMTYRYDNMIYDGSGSLFSVIKAIIMCPTKMLFECCDSEKLLYIAHTMIPLLGLPLITRKYQRYLLLVPYILINLISDYTYQHNILFQYNFGSTAFLIYLCAVNLADLRLKPIRIAAACVAVAVSIPFFCNNIIPYVQQYRQQYETYSSYYQQLADALDTIDPDASVASPTFYCAYLSERNTIYDLRYCSRENLLSCEYVIVKCNADDSNHKHYAANGKSGRENLIALLTENGYSVYSTFGSVFEIYHKP